MVLFGKFGSFGFALMDGGFGLGRVRKVLISICCCLVFVVLVVGLGVVLNDGLDFGLVVVFVFIELLFSGICCCAIFWLDLVFGCV